VYFVAMTYNHQYEIASLKEEVGRLYQLITVLAGGHPLANPLLRLLILVIVGGIDEIA
jgi:hypothetical protein